MIHHPWPGFDEPDNIRREILLGLNVPSGLSNIIYRPAVDVGAHHTDY